MTLFPYFSNFEILSGRERGEMSVKGLQQNKATHIPGRMGSSAWRQGDAWIKITAIKVVWIGYIK